MARVTRPGNAVTEKIDEAMVLLRQARRLALDPDPEPPDPPDPEPPDPADWIQVAAGTALQPVINDAPVGAVLALAPGTYMGSLTLPKAITIRPSGEVPNGRATAAGTGVVIVGFAGEDTFTVTGDGVTLLGITATTPDAKRQIVSFTGTNLCLDRCTLRGDALVGAHRGVMLNGAGATIVDCHIDRIFDIGRDTQAISGWDGTRDVLIDNCYLEGAGETVMFGGADSTAPDRIPTNIRITNSTLTKDPSWFSKGVQIKNALELKACVGFEMTECLLEYGGTSEGQGGYLILFSIRNQDGTAPWTTVQHVHVWDCHARYGGGGIKFLGRDDGQESIPMTDVVVENVLISDLDPRGVTGGDGRGLCFLGGPDAVTIENVTIEGQNLGTSMYLIPPPYPTNMVLRNIKLPPSDYGMKIDGGGSGPAAWQAAMPDAVIELTPEDTGSTYPSAAGA